jgi:hypothetical protein
MHTAIVSPSGATRRNRAGRLSPVTEPLRSPESRATPRVDTAWTMRRLAYFSAVCAILAVPTAALAARDASGDGSLVVQNGAAPWSGSATWTGVSADDTPVVALRITGSVIGRVRDRGRILIDAGSNTDAAVQVLGAGVGRPADPKRSDTAQVWTGNDFTFRAVGGTFTILVYGSHVNLVAAGQGTVRLAGLPDMATGDGKYSLNDKDFVSLPSVQTTRLTIGSGG